MLFKRLLRNAFKPRYPVYRDCSELPFRNFIKVLETKDYKYLYARPAKILEFNRFYNDLDPEKDSYELGVLFGDIMLEYGHLDQNLGVGAQFEDQKILIQLENAYTVLKAMIRLLMLVTPDSQDPEYAKIATQYIEDLRKLGYIIDVTNSKAYEKSLYQADKRSNALVTKIRMKKNEIKSLTPDAEDGEREISFDRIVAQLSAALQFNIDENNLTVSRYCELRKVLKERSKKRK